MARPKDRITDAQREEAWKEYCKRALAVRTQAEVLDLILTMPPPDSPGRPFYTAFRFFAESGRRPSGASDREWGIYYKVTQALVDAGALPASKLDVFKKGESDG